MAALRNYEGELLFLEGDEGDLEDEELLGFYLASFHRATAAGTSQKLSTV